MRFGEIFPGAIVLAILLFGAYQWYEAEIAEPSGPNCPPEFYDEFLDFEACSKNPDCSLSPRQRAALLEERAACKHGPTFDGGDLRP